MKQYEDILAAIARQPVIDTHEHLVTEAEFVAGQFDFADIMTYTGLALAFPNVTLDLAWLHLLSGTQATLWLDEWLDLLPLRKVLAFGGDCLHFF